MEKGRKTRELLASDILLAEHSSFEVGGRALRFALPETTSELRELVEFCRSSGLDPFVFGHGTNILFPDHPGPERVFISLKRLLEFDTARFNPYFSAGTPLALLALVGAITGEDRLLFTHLLPGTLGAGIYINAKYRDLQVGDIVRRVYYLDPEADDLLIRSLEAEKCDFGYKKSIFQDRPWLITGAEICAGDCDPGVNEYIDELMDVICRGRVNPSSLVDFRAFFEEAAGRVRNPPRIFDEISNYREKRRHFHYPSCGSVFKNNYSFGTPTGVLIDRLGLKGKTIGDAMISPHHGNIIINRGGASSGDVRALIRLIQEKVNGAYGFRPETEVVVV